MKLNELIDDMYNSMELKKRTDESEYYSLINGCNNHNEYQSIIREIHDEYSMFPDDTTYDCIHTVLEHLTAYDNDNYIEAMEALQEIESDIYTSDLISFAGSLIGYNVISYYMENNPEHLESDYTKLIQTAQYYYYQTIGNIIISALDSLVE